MNQDVFDVYFRISSIRAHVFCRKQRCFLHVYAYAYVSTHEQHITRMWCANACYFVFFEDTRIRTLVTWHFAAHRLGNADIDLRCCYYSRAYV